MERCQHLRALVRSRLFPLQLPKGLALTPHLAPVRAKKKNPKKTGDKRQGRITQSACVEQGRDTCQLLRAAIYSALIDCAATFSSNPLPLGLRNCRGGGVVGGSEPATQLDLGGAGTPLGSSVKSLSVVSRRPLSVGTEAGSFCCKSPFKAQREMKQW